MAFYTEYSLIKGLNLNAAANYFTKKGDNYKSANGFNSAGLELDTYQMSVTTDMGLGFSTLPWFREGAFALPMDLGFNVQLPLIGQSVPKATVANLEYKLYF